MDSLGRKGSGVLPPLMAMTSPRPVDWSKEFSFEILPIEKLKCHEATQPLLLKATIESIERDGVIRRPILVERHHYIILDGHHRYNALRALGCHRVPAYVVDYATPLIELSLWPGACVDHITKDEVVKQVMERRLLYPPKTTRHKVQVELPEHPVALAVLRQP